MFKKGFLESFPPLGCKIQKHKELIRLTKHVDSCLARMQWVLNKEPWPEWLAALNFWKGLSGRAWQQVWPSMEPGTELRACQTPLTSSMRTVR